VYDADKNILPNANVIVKNTTKGKITNAQGTFTLDVIPENILVISYLGFETKEVVVGDQKHIQIVLEQDFDELETITLTLNKLVTCRKVISKVSNNYDYFIMCRMVEDEDEESKCIYTVKGIEIHAEKAIEEKAIPRLFPNPSANGLFQLQLDKTYDRLTVEVFNMNGQLIQTNTHTKLSKIPQIDISTQPKGIYLIRTIVDGVVLETKKAIKS
jgi:hypothetical protein